MSILTFLFTDIEGSTRRWEADADEMRAALAIHDDVMRKIVEAKQGRLFKHTGDGVCVVFDSPRSAIDAAVAAQRALDLPVRMGIATGEAELRGDDYFGSVLNRAARVMAAGHGGQILLDGATAGLITGVPLTDLGPRRLRDIALPVNVFQICADGLRSEFAPLRTLDSTPGNLRTPTTSFLGREAGIGDLQRELKAHRLVTLTGPGGVGKTRLALEVASRSAHEFPDGVWMIELAPVGDPTAVPEVLAAVLGITQQPGMNLADSVAAAQEGRTRLLLFDNCEHLVDAAAEMIEKILQQSATVAILATSREGLRLPDEQLVPVPSLDVDSSAAMLFLDRASAVGAAISSRDDSHAVAEICRRLDGIPLAIELAASRMQSMTATEVRDRLDDRFRLLTGARRGLERHQTLRHAVQWSYDLLDADEKSLLARISVFAGGFDLSGACAVAETDDEYATLDLLDALVRKSLLIADRSSGRTRFSMLETIRQFAEEQLVSSGEANSVRDKHAHYFATCEDEVLALWDSPRQRDAYEWLARELPNLRAAFRWSVQRDDLDTSTTIAFYAALLGMGRELWEPISWAEELIEPARAADHRRLTQLYTVAAQCFAAGRIDEAIRYSEMGEAALDRGGYAEIPFGFEATLGTAHHMAGKPQKAAVMVRNAIARNSVAVTALSQSLLAWALISSGATDEVMAAVEGLPDAADMSDNPQVKVLALTSYSWAYMHVDPVKAYDASRRALAIARDSGNRYVETTTLLGLSRMAVGHGDPIEAIDLLVDATRSYHDSGSHLLVPGPLALIAALLDRLGRYEPAAVIMGVGDQPGPRTTFPEIVSAIAHLCEALGDQTYESLARTGAAMSTATAVAYALEQIGHARADLLEAESI
jgi:predicted ATPase